MSASRSLIVVVLSYGCLVASAHGAPSFGMTAGGAMVSDAVANDSQYRWMSSNGLEFIRADASWSEVEPTSGASDWSMYDEFVGVLARNGLEWLPMIGYSTPWSSSSLHDLFAPPDIDEYAAFTHEIAVRYGTQGAFWNEHPDVPYRPVRDYEIWNEPNNSDFWRGPLATPTRYAAMYTTARRAIKSWDRRARVLAGSLLDPGSSSPTRYLASIMRHLRARQLGRRAVDGVSWHPYGVLDAAGVADSIRSARSVLSRQRLRSLPIAVTEFGWRRDLVGDRGQGVRLQQTAASLPCIVPSVTRIAPFTWIGGGHYDIATNPVTEGPKMYFRGVREALSTACRGRPAG